MATVRGRKPITSSGVPTVPALAKARTLVAEQDRARQLLERDSVQQTTSPLLGGVIVEGIYPDYEGTVQLIHRLGRAPQGWFPVERFAPFTLFRTDTDTDAEKNVLTLARAAFVGTGDGGAVDSFFKIYVF